VVPDPEPESTKSARYRGRFAPSPTGPLHLGSLVAAMASYLQASVNDGEWLLRIENIDPPREVPGATQSIIQSLQAHGFAWHGDILYQQDNDPVFRDAVQALLDRQLAYACICTREQVRATARVGKSGPIYPGTCANKQLDATGAAPTAIRVSTADANAAFEDGLQGHVESDLATQIGDFIVRRKDGLIGYNLAVVVDDHHQQMTEIVRGADLLDFTPAQIHVQRLLGLDTPRYVHIPVLINPDGSKLSKQTGAPPLDDLRAAENLFEGLRLLRQQPPTRLANAPVDEIWAWARKHWRMENLHGVREIAHQNPT